MCPNMENSKVSIITVCFNAAAVLENTIVSVLSQSFKSIEYIIVDGGSSDGTLDIINKYRNSIDKWVSERDNGVYDAMNKGVGYASGEWILFMNAGDSFYDADSLSRVFSKAYDESTGVIYGDVNLIFPNCGSILRRMDDLQGIAQPLSVCHQSTLSRKELLTTHRFDLSYRIAADANFFYSLWKKNIVFEYVPVCIANYEAVAGVSSTKFVRLFKEHARIVGHTWYNSGRWWVGYFKAVFKELQRKVLSDEMYERKYFKRIESRYKKDDLNNCPCL